MLEWAGIEHGSFRAIRREVKGLRALSGTLSTGKGIWVVDLESSVASRSHML